MVGSPPRKKNHSLQRQAPVVELHQAHQTRAICVFIVLQAFVSFRSVPRILHIFHSQQANSCRWIPHFTSVINWTLRIGLACLNQIAHSTEPWVAIIDHSIDIGVKKILVVLRVPVTTLEEKGKALALSDCECIGLRVSEKTDYETIAEQLSDIFDCAGTPVAIVKDQASNLSKGVSQWKTIAGVKKVVTIDDIGHLLANALKAQFEKSKPYKQFLDMVRKGSSRLRQTPLAFLLPPKIRTKGRFQSISKVAQWGEKMLNVLQVSGRAQEGSPLEKLRQAMPGFSQIRPFIERFAKTTHVVNEVNSLLKNNGLNQKTYRECRQLGERLPVLSKVRKQLLKWLKIHLSKQSRLGMKQTPLLVSSDIIESLFGKCKHIIERSPISDINRMALVIPALCKNKIDQQFVLETFKNTKHEDIAKWEQENIPHTLRKKRQAFLG